MSAAHRGLQPAAMKPVNSYNVNTLIALMSYKNCSSSRNNITGVNPMSPRVQILKKLAARVHNVLDTREHLRDK